MKRYLFLCAWVHGSESAPSDTHVHKQEDLLPQFQKGSDVFAVGISLPDDCVWDDTIAAALGYEEAFHENYTGHDTVSICETLEALGLTEFPTTRTKGLD